MKIDNDPLVEIPTEEWPNLMEYLAKDWPRSILISKWMKSRLEWLQKTKQPTISKVCCPEGDINSGIVFFGNIGESIKYITIYTQNNQLDKLRDTILKTKYIDWNVSPTIAVPMEHVNWYSNVTNTMGHTLQEDVPTHYYTLPKEKALALEVNCPPDVYIAPLKPENVPEINMIWPHRFEGSEQYLCELLRLNCGLGIYSKKDNSLLSWALKFEFGDIGVLQTKDMHRRKGYAAIIVKALSKQVALDGDEPYSFIVTDNFPSMNLFKNIGFEYAGSYSWLT